VRHLPTRTIFEFYPLRDLPSNHVLRVKDFRARLVHVCEGHPEPPPGLITLLSAEAVVMGLHFLSVVKLAEILHASPEEGDDDIPF
jgi:hypothetical protein